MKTSISYLALQFDLNTRLLINSLEGLTAEHLTIRISPHNNPLDWLLTHTVWARYLTYKALGGTQQNPFEGMFENFKPFDPETKYLSLEEIKAEWEKVSWLLEGALKDVTDIVLEAKAPFQSPVADPTTGGLVAFLAQHESYDIGQIALLKKYFTEQPMKY